VMGDGTESHRDQLLRGCDSSVRPRSGHPAEGTSRAHRCGNRRETVRTTERRFCRSATLLQHSRSSQKHPNQLWANSPVVSRVRMDAVGVPPTPLGLWGSMRRK
jgi:hypothetical protein